MKGVVLILFVMMVVNAYPQETIPKDTIKDSIQNKIGFDICIGDLTANPYNGPVIIFSVFYKVKRSKLFAGIDFYAANQNEEGGDGIEVGYDYYLSDKDKSFNWFVETNFRVCW